MTRNHQVLFLSHGGGPMPLLGDAGHADMVENLKVIAGSLRQPKAILVISAHWEEAVATITASHSPELIYDYYGFPDDAYDVTYSCPGSPDLASKIYAALTNADIDAKLENTRGLDHGVFVPLKIMFPQADIPTVQLSLLNNLNANAHILMGAALRDLEYDDLLIIGSGFSFHNMNAFFSANTDDGMQKNELFETWLIKTCSHSNLDEDTRHQQLANWEQAPAARYCHPREEHLLPLHVCYGVAGEACHQYYELMILNKKCSMYLW